MVFFNTIKEHFTCTHGAWDAKCNIIDQDICFIFGKEVNYKWLDSLPDEYNRT